MSKVSGIYLITCRPKGRLPYYYVGQSSDCEKRASDHFSNLRCGRHVNTKMQAIFDKYGEKSFSIEILETCNRSDLDRYEQWWIDEMFGHQRTMNIGKEATSGMRGRKHTDKTRALMSEKAKKRPYDPEKIKKMRASNVNRVITDDERKRRSEAQKGRVISDSHRANMSKARKGVKLSSEHAKKISESLLGERHPLFGKHGKDHPLSKAVVAVCTRTGTVLNFESTMEAKKLGFNPSCISLVCNGKLKTHKGYKWNYVTPSA